MKTEIVLCGVGGQGLISVGEIIGLAASLFEERLYATMTASYGSETRGTFTKTDVILSDQPIGYPNIDSPDVILCLAQVAYERYKDKFRDDTEVYYDTDMVIPAEGAKGKHFGYAFRTMSIETTGNTQAANTIALGVIIHHRHLLHKEAVMKAFAHRFAGRDQIIAINEKAFGLGLSLE
nr:2-oxoacid:acceptor oxidoreductase family protein [Lachnospiraceae bacterium]